MDEHLFVCPMVVSGVRVDVTPMPKGLIVIGSKMHKGHTTVGIRDEVRKHLATSVISVRRVQMGPSGFFPVKLGGFHSSGLIAKGLP